MMNKILFLKSLLILLLHQLVTAFPSNEMILLSSHDGGVSPYRVGGDQIIDCNFGTCNLLDVCFSGITASGTEYGYRYSGSDYWNALDISTHSSGSFTRTVQQIKRTVTYYPDNPFTLTEDDCEMVYGSTSTTGSSFQVRLVRFRVKPGAQTQYCAGGTVDLRNLIDFYDSNVTFSGTGVSGYSFNTSGKNGTYTITASRVFSNYGGSSLPKTPKVVTLNIEVFNPDFTVTNPPDMCSGESVQLQDYTSRETTFSCASCDPGELIGGNLSPSKPGTYTISVQRTAPFNAGCSINKAISVNVGDGTLNVDAGPDIAYCFNHGMIDLEFAQPDPGAISGSKSWSWSSPDPAVDSKISGEKLNINGIAPGTYDITFSFTNVGCTQSDDKKLVVRSLPNINGTSTVPVCTNAGEIDLPGTFVTSPSGGSWSSADPNVDARISGNALNVDINWPGPSDQQVTYTYTDSHSCTNSRDFTVDLKPYPSAPEAVDGSVCEFGNVVLGVTPENYRQFYWYASTGSADVLATGPSFVTPSLSATKSYFVESKDLTNGCISNVRTPVKAEVIKIPPFRAGDDFLLCFNDGDHTLEIESADPDALTGTWNWSSTNSAVNNRISGNTLENTGIAVGPYELTLEYIHKGSCSKQDYVSFEVLPLPEITGNDISLCLNQDSAHLTELSGVSPSTGSWSSATQSVDTMINGEYLSINPVWNEHQTEVLVFSHTDAYGCTNTYPVDVLFKPFPEVPKGIDGAVCGSGNMIIGVANAPGQEYYWYNSKADNIHFNTGSNINTPALTDSTWYYVKARDIANDCYSDFAPVLAAVNPIPNVDAGSDNVFCDLNTIYDLEGQVNPRGGIFTSSELTSQNLDGTTFYAHGLSEGEYIITYEYTHPVTGCKASDDLTLFLGLTLSIATEKTEVATGDLVEFTQNIGSNLKDIEWRFGDGFTSTDAHPGHYYNAPGNYTIEVALSTLDGCNDVFEFPGFITVSGQEIEVINSAGGNGVVEEITAQKPWKVYPNPTRRTAVLLQGPESGQVSLQLFDLSGRPVLHKSIPASHRIALDANEVQGLPSGVYLLTVSTSDQLKTFKLQIN